MSEDLMIGICDDEMIYRDKMIHLLRKLEAKEKEKFEIITFSSGEEVLSYEDDIGILILMEGSMKVKLLVLITALLLTIISLGAANAESDVYYTTENGVELTEAQYDNLTKVFTLDELDCLGTAAIDEMKDDTNLRLIASDEVNVVTKTRYNKNNEPVEIIHREVSEAEAKRIADEVKKRKRTKILTEICN